MRRTLWLPFPDIPHPIIYSAQEIYYDAERQVDQTYKYIVFLKWLDLYMCDNLYYSSKFASKLSEGSNNNYLFQISHAQYYRLFSAILALNKLFNDSLPNSKPSVEGTWINDTFICCKRKRNKFISMPSMNLTTPPFVSVWLKYFVVKSHITSLTTAFVGHSLKLLLIFRENKSVFLVKCPCAEITQHSSWLISFTSVQRSELWYGNQVYTANFKSVYKIFTFFSPLYSLCITE